MFGLTPFVRRNALSSWDPFAEMDRFTDNFFNSHELDLASFRADVKDTGDAYQLEADLPGFNKEDIHLDIDGDCLTISAERHAENEEKDKDGHVLRQERSFGSFSRAFDISGVRGEEITAAYKDGVLTLTMPKKEKTEPTSRRLEIQ